MPYNSLIDYTDAAPLIPEDVAREIIKGTTVKSAAMQLFTHRKMSRNQQRMPVVSLLPTAYFVNGATGLKQTTEINWTNKYLNAEEIAVIVPIPENLISDADYPLWDEIKPLLEEAIAVTLDDAIFFGTNKPTSWPNDILTAATGASNTYVKGTSTVDVAEDINQTMKLVELDGYDVNGFWCYMGLKAELRGLRDTNKMPIFQPDQLTAGLNTQESKAMTRGTIYGVPAYFSRAAFDKMGSGLSDVVAICGDWAQGIIGIREDITYKVLDQAVIQDNTGAIIYNLAQQDMVALRVTFRAAFQVPNPPNRLQTTEANRYPFACLVMPAS